MKLLKVLLLTMIAQAAIADSYKYEVRKVDSHVIHIVTINPKEYETKFVKAHNGVFGRELVRRIAEQENADIAINGGFFEIGGERDGMPSCAMVVKGRIFSLIPSNQDQLILSFGNLSIASYSLGMSVIINEHEIHIDKYNKFPEKNDVVLYTDTFGDTTLTSFKERNEIFFDENYKLLGLYEHGNIAIPRKGFVLSLPKSYKIADSKLKLINNNPILKSDEGASIVTGIPMLLSKGNINPEILKRSSAFYKKPNARTALGLKKTGEIVLVVAEHFYKKDLNDVTVSDVIEILRSRELTLSQHYKKLPRDLTISELQEVIKDAYGGEGANGLTIHELANLMLELECDSAINLDGGGSSTLWIDGKIIGQTVGDGDEGCGKLVERPVSDAIIFKKKQT